jgi:hypothetical protein
MTFDTPLHELNAEPAFAILAQPHGIREPISAQAAPAALRLHSTEAAARAAPPMSRIL